MTDTIQPPPERPRQGQYVRPAERQTVDDEGERATPYELGLRALQRLRKAKREPISEAEWAAGMRFHLDYSGAHGSFTPAMDYSRDRVDTNGNGKLPSPPEALICHANVQAALGALNDEQGMFASLVLGKGFSIKAYARHRKLGEGVAGNVARATLKRLAEHYQEVDGRSETGL